MGPQAREVKVLEKRSELVCEGTWLSVRTENRKFSTFGSGLEEGNKMSLKEPRWPGEPTAADACAVGVSV